MWQFYVHFYELSVGENPNSANYFLSIQFLPLQLFTVIFMTPTREQLELAAKAAGLESNDDTGEMLYWFHSEDTMGGGWGAWNPVTDKSDSFDLMVTCGIEVKYYKEHVLANYLVNNKLPCMAVTFYKDHNNDKGLAIMWAVFLCAVEIGRSL